MKDIRFACPRCTQSLEAAPDMAGQPVECPSCQHSFTVPSPSPSVSAVPKRKPSRWPVAVVVFLVATVPIIWFMIRLFSGASPAGAQRTPKPAPPREYITQSYYDLREEEKGLYSRSGLSSDDTEAKREAVMRAAHANFRRQYVGRFVKWTGGYVSDVEEEYGRFICKIEMDQDAIFSTTDIRFPVSRHQAMNLKKYKEVLIDGKIKTLEGSLKVELEKVQLSYTGRSLNDMCEERKSQNQQVHGTQ